jgi:tripartite-type tricarboxylate transporter receptor subunit TctC
MDNFKTTSDKLSKILYESYDLYEKGYRTATDFVRLSNGGLWSPSVDEEVQSWYNSEKKKIIAEAGYTEDEWRHLEEQESDAWYAQIEKDWDEYQQSMKDAEPFQVIHMDDDTEPDDVE